MASNREMEVLKIYLSPQVSADDEVIHYNFQGDKITAIYKNQMDVFDFSGLPNGVAENITSDIDMPIVIGAKRENGLLYVKLINLILRDATEEERFPTWIDSGDYKYKSGGMSG